MSRYNVSAVKDVGNALKTKYMGQKTRHQIGTAKETLKKDSEIECESSKKLLQMHATVNKVDAVQVAAEDHDAPVVGTPKTVKVVEEDNQKQTAVDAS